MTTPKPKTKAKKLAIKKATTITEIKYWLQGIIEFQDSDWVPNAEQWETVKDKIMSLVDSEVPKVVNSPTINPVANSNNVVQSLGVEIEQGVAGPVRWVDPPNSLPQHSGPADPIFGTNVLPQSMLNEVELAAKAFV